MTDRKTTRPPAEETREARLAAALRANLQRRKAQGRARKAGEAGKSPDSHDTVDDKGTKPE